MIWRLALPAALLTLVLFCQPCVERREIFSDRACIDITRACQFLQRVLPRLTLSDRQHFAEAFAGFGIAIHGAFAQRSFESCGVTQRFVELELKNEGQEIA